MSLNLCLVKGSQCNFEDVYQTPTSVTYEALRSDNPTKVYKDWVLKTRVGKYEEEIQDHFDLIDNLLAEGYSWEMI